MTPASLRDDRVGANVMRAVLVLAIALWACTLAGCRVSADNTSQGKVALDPVWPWPMNKDGANPCGACAAPK